MNRRAAAALAHRAPLDDYASILAEPKQIVDDRFRADVRKLGNICRSAKIETSSPTSGEEACTLCASSFATGLSSCMNCGSGVMPGGKASR